MGKVRVEEPNGIAAGHVQQAHVVTELMRHGPCRRVRQARTAIEIRDSTAPDDPHVVARVAVRLAQQVNLLQQVATSLHVKGLPHGEIVVVDGQHLECFLDRPAPGSHPGRPGRQCRIPPCDLDRHNGHLEFGDFTHIQREGAQLGQPSLAPLPQWQFMVGVHFHDHTQSGNEHFARNRRVVGGLQPALVDLGRNPAPSVDGHIGDVDNPPTLVEGDADLGVEVVERVGHGEDPQKCVAASY